jgi:putative phage-type endonuclease
MAINKSLIGGSDIGAILGLNPYKSAIDVWDRIVNGVEQEAGRAALRGIRLELAILEWWLDENHLAGESAKRGVSGESAPFRWSLDGLIVPENEVIEIKTVGWNTRHEWNDGPPSSYVAQCQWYMHFVDSPRCHLVKFDGNDIEPIVIERDIEYGKMLVSEAQAFWDKYVVTKTPPPPDGSAAYTEHQKRIERQAMTANDNSFVLADAIHRYNDSMFAQEQAKRHTEKLRQELIEYMGPDHDLILSPAGKVSFKEQTRKTTDWEQIAKDLGATSDQIGKHTTVKKHRVFRVG